MPKSRFWNFGGGSRKEGNNVVVKPAEYSSKSTKGMLSQLRGACAALARSFRPGMSSSSSLDCRHGAICRFFTEAPKNVNSSKSDYSHNL